MVGLLLVPSISLADTTNWSWEWPHKDLPEGFRVYRALQDGSKELMVTVPSEELTASFVDTLDERCQTYYATAYIGDVESDPSNTADWCRESEVPQATLVPGKPVTFTFTVSIPEE